MKNTLIFFKNNYRRLFHNKTKLLVLLILPVIVVTVGVMANSFSSDSISIGFIENKNHTSPKLKNRLSKIKGIELETLNNDSIQNSDLIMGKFELLVTEKSEVYEYRQAYNNNQYNLSRFFNDLNNDKQISSLSNYKLITNQTPLSKVISFLILLFFVTCTLNVSNMITDRKNGIYTRIRTAPIFPIEYFLGNMLYNISITVVQIFNGLLLVKLTGIAGNTSNLKIILLGILLTLFTTSFGILINSIFSNDLYANLSATVIALLFSLFGGTFIAFVNMPPLLQAIGRFSPVKWFIEMINSTSSEVTIFYSSVVIVTSCILVVSSLLVDKSRLRT
ncbi:ABC transporter permease [Listeria monocytogenes]|nr:ABC transporter permease [Listeria monocytogenes]